MKNASSLGAAFALALFATSAFGSQNVFDDAVFWFRGGKDCVTSDGQMQTGEFFDDLHANDSSHANHKMAVSGYSENGKFVVDDVVIPALGITSRMQVLDISDNQRDGSTSRLSVCPYTLFAQNSISNKYTIVCRLKFDSCDGEKWLLKIGSNGQTGLQLGFQNHPNYPGCKYVYAWIRQQAGDSGGKATHFYDTIIPTNMWVDLGVVVGNGKLRVGIAAPQSLTVTDNGSNKYTPTIAFQNNPMATEILSVRPSNQSSWYSFFSKSTSDSGRFVGKVQQLALWGRMLSDHEVLEAFGMPRPAIFRTGFDNACSDEFGGMRSGATQTIEGLGSWQGVSDTMLAGDTWTVNFDALRDEAGLPQIFSMHGLTSSSTAEIDVSVNGTSLGRRYVGASGYAFWPVASNIVVSGANTATIRRTDGGTGAFRLDSMELGGSIGVGVMDFTNSNDDMVEPGRINIGVSSAAAPNPQLWSKNLLTYDGISNIHFRVWIDPEVAKSCPSKLRLRARCANRGTTSPYLICGDETVSLVVNGNEKATRDSSTSWTDLNIDFMAGELNDGWNDIELRATPYGTCYWMIDYYRFETFLAKGFSIPEASTVLVVR